MSDNKNEHAVVALFDNLAAANAAIASLEAWDKATDSVKLGNIGTISKDGDKIKTNAGRKGGKGAKAGAIVGIIAGVLSGGVTLIGGALMGAVGGGVLGSFFKKSVGLTKEEIDQLGVELDAGKVAVVVACDDNEVEATSEELRRPAARCTTTPCRKAPWQQQPWPWMLRPLLHLPAKPTPLLRQKLKPLLRQKPTPLHQKPTPQQPPASRARS